MKVLYLIGFVILTAVLLISRHPFASASGNAAETATYEVVITQEMYLPAYPCHINDSRYSSKTDFETRTVTILQPYQNGQPLQNRPVVFFVHGGAWTDDYADWYTDYLTPTLVAEQGWVVVNVDYRLTADDVTFADGTTSCPTPWRDQPIDPGKVAWYDENLQDVTAAFDWTVKNIAAYGGDVQNIFLFGHSAGGHLVSLLATRDTGADPNPYPQLRRWMRGVISMSGAYDLKNLNKFVFTKAISQTFQGGITDTVALDEASPITYVQSGTTLPPFYILYCEVDLPSLPEQATSFESALQTANNEVTMDYLPGYNHASEMVAIADSEEAVTQNIVAYIESHTLKTVYLPLIMRN